MKLIRVPAVGIFLFLMAGSGVLAQPDAGSSFPGTLSFDATFGAVYNRYHGASIGARLVAPLLSVPTLTTLWSTGGIREGDLLLLPGVKLGVIHADNPLPRTEVMSFAPDLALHYPLMRLTGFGLYGGPAAEFIFTNNYNKYLVVPCAGVDIGAQLRLGAHVSIAAEHRWILRESVQPFINNADFPRHAFAEASLVFRVSLPWKAEEDGYRTAARENQSLRMESERSEERLRSVARRADSLESELATVKARRLRAARSEAADSIGALATVEPVGAHSPAIDRYNAAQVLADPVYAFTKDPFKAGNLTDDQYLQNILIDILDDEYVWRLSPAQGRMADAEKIRMYFVLHDATLGRRIEIGPETDVRYFSLTCLGKVSGGKSRKGR